MNDTLRGRSLTVVDGGAACTSRYRGDLFCDLRAGHTGPHGEVMSRDEEGRVEDAVTWTDEQADAPDAGRVAIPHGIAPEDVEMVALLDRSVPAIRVIDLYEDVETYIAQVQAALAPAIARRQNLKAVLDAKMRDTKAAIVVHGGFRARYDAGKPIVEKREAELLQLRALKNEDGEPLIPRDELDKAIWTATPPPVVKTHLTYLRKLEKYGEKAQAILAKGLVEVQPEPVLVIERVEPEQKNVTPVGGAV